MKFLGIASADFHVTDKLLIRYCAVVRDSGKKKCYYSGTVHHIFIDYEKAYVSGEKYYAIFS
jgi:antirestriction protein ArdC